MSYDIGDDQEQQDILLGFVEEGREMLDEVEPLLIELEQTADEEGEIDNETINTVFRLFHSLKGGAGFLDLTTISSTTHDAETLLDMFRKGVGQLSSDHIDLLNRTCDFLRKLLDQIETEFHDHGFEDESKDIIRQLQAAIAVLKGEPVPADQGVEGSEEENGSETVESTEAQATEQPAATPEGDEAGEEAEEALQLTISPEMVKQFTNEADELLEKAEESLLNLEKDPNDQEQIQQAFRSFHSFKGNSGFLGYSDLEKLSHGAESVLDRFREGQLAPTSKVINLILEIIDFMRSALTNLNNGKPPHVPAAPGLLHLLQDYSSSSAPAPVKETPKQEPEVPKAETPTPEPKNKAMIGATQPEPPKTPEEKNEGNGKAKPASKVEKTAPKQEKAEPTGAEKLAEIKSAARKAMQKESSRTSGASVRKSSQRQSVRVDVEKLDILLDLVGELVISEAMVAQNPDLKGVNVSLDRFEKAVMQLDKITRDLQDVSTSIRMIPLSSTFRRMVRLVRDLSQKAGKKVQFNIVGEETEVDKTVIEQITDPLIHIIRNSIDHGLETPEDRGQIGKDPVGDLTLEAKYVGGEVWITVEDDGRGLNREKIIKRALDRGLIEGDPDELPDDQVWQFIFHPGFSTADKITDVSGRGVGMDVVRRNIENIRGKVDIRTKAGQGTMVILRLPLTLAIIDGMIIRVGDERYTLPITAIRESIQVTKNQVTETMDSQEIIRVRESLLPVVRLNELLGVNTEKKPLEEGIISIVENEGRRVCLFVDELLGQQQIVIKGLSEYVGNHACISGCTILGDGDISLILDVAGIIDQASNAQAAAQAMAMQEETE